MRDMKEIPLTKGFVAVVDDEDYDRLMAIGKWQALVTKNTVYAVHDTNSKGTFLMHRVILNATAPRVDHKDHNGLNNQKCNLRECSNSQNLANSRKRHGKTSKYKGVSFHRRDGNWAAWVSVDGKTRYLGYFPTEAKAAAAYNFAAMHHYGDFARLNEVAA